MQEEFLFSGNFTIYASDWCHDILVMAPEMQEEILFSGELYIFYLVPQDPGHGTRNARGDVIFWWVVYLLSGAMRSWSQPSTSLY